MPTSLINGYTTPEATAKFVTHEDLAKLVKQMTQGDIMRFANAAERTAIFGTLKVSPPKGSISHLLDNDRHFRWSGSAWLPLEANSDTVNGASGGGNTTSATYVDMPSGSALSGFTKLAAGTQLHIAMALTGFATVGSTVSRFAVNISGTDYDVTQLFFNNVEHLPVSGFRKVPAGIAAGVYTIQGRWRRVSGTGTLTTNVDDWFSMTVEEKR